MQQINAAHDSGGGLDGGISAAPTPAGLESLRAVVDRMIGARNARGQYLADARHWDTVTGADGQTDELAVATNAAAAEDLDELLRTLQQVGIASPGADRQPSIGQRAAPPGDWADAGYTSPTAIADWTSIGIDTPAVARQWVDAGFTVESAARWIDVPDMTPSEAATCAEAGMTPTDVQRIRRADPGWARTDPVAEAAAPDTEIGM